MFMSFFFSFRSTLSFTFVSHLLSFSICLILSLSHTGSTGEQGVSTMRAEKRGHMDWQGTWIGKAHDVFLTCIFLCCPSFAVPFSVEAYFRPFQKDQSRTRPLFVVFTYSNGRADAQCRRPDMEKGRQSNERGGTVYGESNKTERKG